MRRKSIFVLLGMSVLLSVALATIFTEIGVTHAASSSSKPRQYVALGDSLPFGYQPNNDFTHGYVTDLFQTLQAQDQYSALVNLSCTAETTTTFIQGDPQSLNKQRACLSPQVQRANQLSAAVAYIQQHASDIGLVTLQIGIDDFLNNGAINATTCAINTSIFQTQLAIVDKDLTKTILPQLKHVLRRAPAHLALIGYYNPLQQHCPATTTYLETLNQHLQHDAKGFALFISIDNLFTGANLCQTTWICTAQNIHPTSQGYTLVADRIYQFTFIHRVYSCAGGTDGFFNILSDYNVDWDCFQGPGTLDVQIWGANKVCTGSHTGAVVWYAGNNLYIKDVLPYSHACYWLNNSATNYVKVTQIIINSSAI